VTQHACDGRAERSEREPITAGQRRRLRPVLGPRAKVARAENDRQEVADLGRLGGPARPRSTLLDRRQAPFLAGGLLVHVLRIVSVCGNFIRRH
jgi:hypothetical protein